MANKLKFLFLGMDGWPLEGCIIKLQWSSKFYNKGLLFVGVKTLGTFIKFGLVGSLRWMFKLSNFNRINHFVYHHWDIHKFICHCLIPLVTWVIPPPLPYHRCPVLNIFFFLVLCLFSSEATLQLGYVHTSDALMTTFGGFVHAFKSELKWGISIKCDF